MRHTHADWAPGQDDHARPLSPRGRDEARRLGNWLKNPVICQVMHWFQMPSAQAKVLQRWR